MDIIQTFLLCIFGVCIIWFIGRAIDYDNQAIYYRHNDPNKPTFWDK
jgi:hypothetical protein